MAAKSAPRLISSCGHPSAARLRAGGGNPSPSPPAGPSAKDLSALSTPALLDIIRADDGWPDNPHEVPIWRLAQEERARRIGLTLPGYRTRAEFEAWVDAAKRSLAAVSTVSVTADESARRFVSWCISQREVTTLSSDDLDAAYALHCQRERIEPHAQNMIRGALRRVPGVTTTLGDKLRSGRRHRPTIWTISAAPAEPLRAAA